MTDDRAPAVIAPASTLSVCCVTNAPVAHVEAVFAPFRPIADAFVVVYDDRVPPDRAAGYERIASRAVPVRFEHLERHLALAHELCPTEWVLRIDTDEVPSQALLVRLPELLADPHVQEYWLTRRWLYPTLETWLDEVPWAPDHQLRLVRNTPSLRFSGELHSSAEPRQPSAYVEESLYHLDCVLNDAARRRIKALRYEVIRPGLTATGGGPMWSFYGPEGFARGSVAEVPPVDQAAIRAVLDGAGCPPDDAQTRNRRRGRATDGGSIDLGHGVTWLERDRRFQQEAVRPITLRLRNETSAVWPGYGAPEAVVTRYRWRSRDADARTEPLVLLLPPGAERVVVLPVQAPESPGPAVLDIDVVNVMGMALTPVVSIAFDVVAAPEPPTRREVRPARRRSLLRRHRLTHPIPNTIHRVWLGGGDMPQEHLAYGETWREHHPAWRFQLWTDANAPFPSGVERARNIAERSDLVRYEVIRRYGGIYVDTDVECLKPIDALLDGVEAFAAYEVPGRLCNAVIGATPGHRAFEDAVALAAQTVGIGNYPSATATVFLTRVLEPLPEVTLFGSERFYPYLWDEDRPSEERYGDAYAVHHWAKSWVPAAATDH